MNDYQQCERDQLSKLGYEFEVTSDGYTVRHNGKWVHGASVMLPRSKPLHHKHREANVKMFLEQALSIARRHYQKEQK